MVDLTLKQARCIWCYRTHPFLYLEIDNTVSVGYVCEAKKNLRLEKIPFVPSLPFDTRSIKGLLKPLTKNAFEVIPMKNKLTFGKQESLF